MTRRITRVPPIEHLPDGTPVFNLDSDAANPDWLRAARLQRRAQAGDQDAARALRELFDTPTYRIEAVGDDDHVEDHQDSHP